MGLGLVELPEELISEIIETAADFYVPPSRPSVGIQCLLNDSSVAALSFTCQKIRRLALPILFRSLRIAPGFPEDHNEDTEWVERENNQPIVDALRTINPWQRECIKDVTVYHYTKDLQVFAIDILSMLPALEQIELSGQLWDDVSVLEAVHNHPTLQRCIFWRVEREYNVELSLPYHEMHKVYWESFVVTRDNSRLQDFLDVGLQIESLEIEIGHRNMNWAQLKFSSALRDIYAVADIEQRSLFWDFVARHPSVESLNVRQQKLAVFVMGQINSEITSMLEESSEPAFRVQSAVLARMDNGWRLKEVHLEVIYTDQDSYLNDFSGKLQRFGRLCPGITDLTLSIKAPEEMSLLPGLSVDSVFKQAVSTMQDLGELSIDLPPAIISHFKARRDGLPDQVYDEALGLSGSIATAAPKLTKIRYFNFFPPYCWPRYGRFVVVVERAPEVQVFEAEEV